MPRVQGRLKKLDNAVVLVTGSSRGIGAATAKAFAAEKARVIVTYFKSRDKGEQTVQACLQAGAREAFLLELDITELLSIENAKIVIGKKFGKIDVLVNNAGRIAWKPFRSQSPAEISTQITTNLEGTVQATHAFLPLVKDCIVNVASGAGKNAFAELVPYCATKFGIRGFSQALALEEPLLRIFCVNPGMTATQMTNYRGEDPGHVAHVIVQAVKGEIAPDENNDVDVWNH